MEKYIAFLRGINVGGHKRIPMPELKKVFEKQGFLHVKTSLNTGNVIFEGEKASTMAIPGMLENAFGFFIGTIVLPFDDICKIVASNPFKSIEVSPERRLYVTFLAERSDSQPEVPYFSADGSFRIIHHTNHAVFSVLDLGKTKTTDAMNILEKEFGKQITTRNYNTVVKIAGL